MNNTNQKLGNRSIVSVKDYLRPWKIFSLVCGISILILGSYLQPAMDWDIPISFLMAISTYIFSPITSRTLFIADFRNNIRHYWYYWALSIFGLWFSVDGVYWLYWSFKAPEVIGYMRDANFKASLFLYLICGFIWLHDGGLIDFFKVDK